MRNFLFSGLVLAIALVAMSEAVVSTTTTQQLTPYEKIFGPATGGELLQAAWTEEAEPAVAEKPCCLPGQCRCCDACGCCDDKATPIGDGFTPRQGESKLRFLPSVRKLTH